MIEDDEMRPEYPLEHLKPGRLRPRFSSAKRFAREASVLIAVASVVGVAAGVALAWWWRP